MKKTKKKEEKEKESEKKRQQRKPQAVLHIVHGALPRMFIRAICNVLIVVYVANAAGR